MRGPEWTKVDCACRKRVRWGSRPEPACGHCKGSGYVDKESPHAKDWSKDPEPEDET